MSMLRFMIASSSDRTWKSLCQTLSFSYFISLILLFSVAYVIYYTHFHALASVPGPFFAKFTNLWRYYHYLQGDFQLVQMELFKKHNTSVIRIGPNSVVFSDATSYKAIHGHGGGLERGDFYRMVRFADLGESSTFSAKENALHREKRKKLVSVAFTPRAIQSYDHTISKNANLWLQQVSIGVDRSGHRMDVAYLNKALTFDTIYEILMGESPQFLHMWTTQRFQTAIGHKEWTSRHGFGWGYLPVVAIFLELIGSVTKRQFHKKKFDRKGLPILRTLIYWQHLTRCEKILLPAAKSAPIENTESTVLHRLVSLPAGDSRKMRRDAEIMAELRTLTFAGPGTTAAALTSVLYDLARHEQWQERIRNEANGVFVDDHFPSQTSSPLLMAFIKESLRLRTMDPLAFPLEVKQVEGITMPNSGIILPRGTEVGALLCSVNRDEKVWGSDANVFKPERWLLGDQKQVRAMLEAWAVFGRGARACPGHRVALSLIHKCLTGVLRRWRISADEGALEGRCNFEMAYKSCPLTFQPL